MSNFKPYRLISLRFQGEVRKTFVIGPLQEDNLIDVSIARNIFSRIYRALVDSENMRLGLGNAHPDERIDVTMDPVDTWDSSKTSPIQLRTAMVEQMIQIFKENVFARIAEPKPKWTIGSVLKSLWQNFVEFLDDMGSEVAKGTDSHTWV